MKAIIGRGRGPTFRPGGATVPDTVRVYPFYDILYLSCKNYQMLILCSWAI